MQKMNSNKEDDNTLDIVINKIISFSTLGYTFRGENRWIQLVYKLLYIVLLIFIPSFFAGLLATIVGNENGTNVSVAVSVILIMIIGIIELLNYGKSRIEDCIRDFLILVSVAKSNSKQTKSFFIRAVGFVFSIFIVAFVLYLGFLLLLNAIGIDGKLSNIINIMMSGSLSYVLLIYGKRGISTDLIEYRKALIDLTLGITLFVFSAIQICEYDGAVLIEDLVGIVMVCLWAFSLLPNIVGDVRKIYNQLADELSHEIAERRTIEILNCYYWKYKVKHIIYRCLNYSLQFLFGKHEKKEKSRIIKTIVYFSVYTLLAIITVIFVQYLCEMWISPLILKGENWLELWIAGIDSHSKSIIASVFAIGVFIVLLLLCISSIIKKIKSNQKINWKEIVKDIATGVAIVMIIIYIIVGTI